MSVRRKIRYSKKHILLLGFLLFSLLSHPAKASISQANTLFNIINFVITFDDQIEILVIYDPDDPQSLKDYEEILNFEPRQNNLSFTWQIKGITKDSFDENKIESQPDVVYLAHIDTPPSIEAFIPNPKNTLLISSQLSCVEEKICTVAFDKISGEREGKLNVGLNIEKYKKSNIIFDEIFKFTVKGY